MYLRSSKSGMLWRLNTTQERLPKTRLQYFLMLFDLSKINEYRYITRHLSIYQATGKLNSKFCFSQQWVGPTWNSCTRIPRCTKTILSPSSYAQRDLLILGATMTFYAPRVLKNIAKGDINQVIDVVLVIDCRFV